MFDPLRTRPGKSVYYTHKGQVIRPKKVYMDPFVFNESDYKKYLIYAIDNHDVNKPIFNISTTQYEIEGVDPTNIPNIYNYISTSTPLKNNWKKATGNIRLLSIGETGEGYLASKIGIFLNNNELLANTLSSDHFFCINNRANNDTDYSFDLETNYCNCPFIIENLQTQLKITIQYVDMQLTFSSLESSGTQYICGNTSMNPNSNMANQANNIFAANTIWQFPLPGGVPTTYRTYVHCKKMEFTVPVTSYFGSVVLNFTEFAEVRDISAAAFEIPELNVE